jgi:hypothetical protein
MREQFNASGDHAVKLVATDTPQFIPGTGEIVWRPTPSIQRMLHTPHVSCAHVRFFLSDRSPSAGLTSPGLPARAIKPRNTEIPLFPKTSSRGIARARARAKSRSFDHPVYSAHVNASKPNPDQPRQSGGKPVKQPLALTSPTWVRGVRPVLREGAHPRGAENREKQNSCFSPKPCQVVDHARARVGKIRLFDQPYNPRMLTQVSLTRTNPGKAEAKSEPGGANTPRSVRGSSPWPLGGLAAMGCMLGRLSKGFLLASHVWVRVAKPMGAIHRLSPVPAVTAVRVCVRGRQLRRVTVRCQLRDGCRRLAEIISREIAGNRRGTGGLTRWLVSLWRKSGSAGAHPEPQGLRTHWPVVFGLAWPLQPLGPKTPDSPRAEVARGRRRKGAVGFSGNCGPAHFAGSHGSN